MRTKIYTTALTILIASIFSVNTFASEINFKEENYVDDIPFDTEMVVAEYLTETEFSFTDEAYIDDIPFSTELVVENETTEYDFEDETYVDDIPFNTENVVDQHEYLTALEMDFNFENEEEVDDIPFNTFNIVNKTDCINYPVLYSAIHNPVVF